MRREALTNLPASVHQRLLNLAKQTGRPFNELLQYFAMERFLYRLSVSPHSERFILKGALMLAVWDAPSSRPTVDIDLLARADNAIESIVAMMQEVCRQEVEPDGLVFSPESLQGRRITEDAEYQGVRVRFEGRLGNARLRMQIDIGFGDVVIPAPQPVLYPVLLGFPAPRLRGYSRESSIAEKLGAMVKLDLPNSRMKDFYDIWLLSRHFEFDGPTLCRAIAAVFSSHGVPLPEGIPTALSDRFAEDTTKRQQWAAFLRTSGLDMTLDLDTTVALLREFLMPPLASLVQEMELGSRWRPGLGWQPA